MRNTDQSRGRGESIPKTDDDAPSTQAMLMKLRATPDLDSFISENRDAFLGGTIRQHMNALLEAHGVSKAEAIERANIERGYGYQILRGEKNASRDKYLRLAIGIGLDLEETQRLLTVARHGILYSKVLRDAILIFAINNRLSILAVECLLEEKGVEPLD